MGDESAGSRETLTGRRASVYWRQAYVDWEKGTVLRAVAGDRAAFSSLAESCRPWLFGLCLRLVRDRATAEDLAQEALLRAFRDLAQLRDPGRFRPWLSKIAVNLCRMHLRRQVSRPQEAAHDGERADVEAEQGDAPMRVDEALAQMDTETRRLLLLFYVEGMNHRELAELLSLSTTAVKSRLHRARERMRKEMLSMMPADQRARLGVEDEESMALRTVLLVEPDEAVREAIRRALTEAGYKVIVLPTGEAALDAVEQRKAQLLILDKHCVEPNWVEVLTLIMVDAWSREHVKRGVFVDPGNQRDVLLAWQAGADFCLARPPEAAEVVEMVRRVCEV
jgi:RNA polymerase sigma-70 factor (ECF subfamily)